MSFPYIRARALRALLTSLALLPFLGARAAAFTCATTVTVKQAGGGTCRSIQACVTAMPASLTGDYCIDVQDSATYVEQVTLSTQAPTNNGHTIVIGAVTTANTPVINPPAASTAAFQIAHASVTLVSMNIQPGSAVTYGVFASSAYVTISSVNVQDASGKTQTAGFSLASWNTVSYSSVTASGAHGFYLAGSSMTTISYSSAQVSGASIYAWYLQGGASSNTFMVSLASNSAGTAAFLDANAHNNLISGSTISAAGAGTDGLNLFQASSNTVTASVIYNATEVAAHIRGTGASNNVIRLSTLRSDAPITSANPTAVYLSAASNTITQSFLIAGAGYALFADNSSVSAINNTISLSTITNASGTNATFVFATGASSNTIAQSYLANTGGDHALSFGDSLDTVSQSTIVVNSPSWMAVDFNGGGAVNNTVSRSYIVNQGGGQGVRFSGGASTNTIVGSTITAGDFAVRLNGAYYNTISASSMTSNTAASPALYLTGSSSGNVITGTYVGNFGGTALKLDAQSNLNVISLSTMTSYNASAAALVLSAASSNTLVSDFVQGSTAVYVTGGSSGTIISGSVLVATSAVGAALAADSIGGASINLALTSSTLSTPWGGANSAALYLGTSNGGTFNLSSNTLLGGQYGVYLPTQTPNTIVYLTSNTIVPTLNSAFNAYGLYINGLTSGATIQSNAIVWRQSGSQAGFTAYGLYTQSAAGINFDHNRIDEPGLLTAGSFVGAYFNGASQVAFKFNDLNSTGTAFTNAYLMQLAGSTVAIRDNVFLSSFVVSGSSASLWLDAASGFASDYNDWYSSNSASTLVWGSKAYAYPWSVSISRDANSISANPLWNNAGVEDFHPRSTVGRYNPATQAFVQDAADSPTLDAADPIEPTSYQGLGPEPTPNGNRANQGSYGQTSQASESRQASTLCPVAKTVCASGNCNATTISGGLGLLPATLTGYSCVVIEDNSTYNEQVTVQNFTMNGSSLTIMADPASGLRPVVAPNVVTATAAFQIMNASVNVLGLNIAPAASLAYGVYASSAYVTISSVNVQDAPGQIWSAGISISSWSTVSYSSVTVGLGNGIYLAGSTMTSVSNTPVLAYDQNHYAVYMANASSNVLTRATLQNDLGYVVGIDAGSSYNTISLSTITSASSNRTTVEVAGSSNSITNSYVALYGYNVYAGAINLSGSYNTVSVSTMVAWGDARLFQGDPVSITGSRNTLSNDALLGGIGHALSISNGAGGTSVSYATLQNNTTSFPTILLTGASSSTFVNDVVQGSTMVYVSGSTGTVIGGSVLVATNTAGYGLYLGQGSMNLTLTSSTVTGAAQGAGVYLDQGNFGSLVLSTNVIAGSQYGIYVATQASGTQLSLTSNTIQTTLSSARTTYGLYLNGLASGATIQNNSVVWRQAGSASGQTAYGLYAQSVSGVNFDHNRISQPGMLNAGSFVGAAFNGAQQTQFKFNDVSSSGTAFTNAYLLQLNVSSVSIRDNVFVSSFAFATTGSSASLTADAASGLISDYNDWYSSTSANTLVWGAKAYAYPWRASIGQDANSISSDPLWNNASAGAEDFHSRSTVGRYNPATQTFVQDAADSPTLDAGDPAEPYSLEPTPNAGRANQGSYGDTAQASESYPQLCPITKNVNKTSGPYTTIQAAINAIPNPLSGYSCVVIRDGATYNEQVTVQNFAMSGSSLTIMADPASGLRPIVSPPNASVAGFNIVNASVNIVGLTIRPISASVSYGVYASSPNVSITSINVDGGWVLDSSTISVAGISLSSWSTVYYSSISVGQADGVLFGGSGNLVSFSTMATNTNSDNWSDGNGADSKGLPAHFYGAGSTGNAITNSYMLAQAGNGPTFAIGSNNNTITFSTMVTRGVTMVAAWFRAGSSSNTISQSYLDGTASGVSSSVLLESAYNTVNQSRVYSLGVGIVTSVSAASYNTISYSTIVAQSNDGVSFQAGSSNTILNSYLQGKSGFSSFGSTGTTIGGSVLVSVGLEGLWMGQGSVNLTVTSSTLLSQGGVAGVYLAAGNSGLIRISSNVIPASQYGVFVATQTSNTAIYITSNVIAGSLDPAGNTYSIYVNGLQTGATVQNNVIVWRQSGSAAGQTAYGFYAQSAAKINVDHNRIDQPGMITAGSFVGAAFNNATQIAFKFNDVNSSGTAFTNAYMIQLLNSSTVTIRDNVFVSSFAFATTGSSASLTADAASGFKNDYNDWYSSTSANTLVWGANAYAYPWSGAIGQDANSIAANPQWNNASAGVEDFHPRSSAGRYAPQSGTFVQDGSDSPTVDLADPTEPFANEPAPNGGRANLGSYGNTAQASESAGLIAGCAVQKNVNKSGGPYTTIQAAVNALPPSLAGQACVVIKDGSTYNEQVTVQNFTNNGSSITIMADPASGLRPIVAPNVATATGAFVVSNASVSIVGLDIRPAASVAFGVQVSSAYVSISSVNVQDAGGNVWAAGISLTSGWGRVAYSSVTVSNAHGFYLSGATATFVSYSTAQATSASFFAVLLTNSASSNTLTGLRADNPNNVAVRLDNGATYDTITLSTITSNLPGVGAGGALFMNGTASNTITRSYVYNGAGDGIDIYNTGAAYNVISLSTVASNGLNTPAVYLFATATNTITQSFLMNPNGYGLYLNGGSNDNTVSQSTMTGGTPVGSGSTALYISGRSSSNTITSSYIDAPQSQGVYIDGNSNYNAIRFSTVASGGPSPTFFVTGASYTTVWQSLILSTGAGNVALDLDVGSAYNAIQLSTITSPVSGGNYAAAMNGSSSNTILSSYIGSGGPVALSISPDATGALSRFNTISQTTVAITWPGGNAVLLTDSSNTITQSWIYSNTAGGGASVLIQGVAGSVVSFTTITALNFTAGVIVQRSSATILTNDYIATPGTSIVVDGSTTTVIGASALASACSSGGDSWALDVVNGSRDVTVSSNAISCAGAGVGSDYAIRFDPGTSGLLKLSTNVVTSAHYGIAIGTMTPGSQVWIASNTILNAVVNSSNTYALFLNGLMTGATIQNNAIVWRQPTARTGVARFGLYALSSSGLNIDHNRLDEPGLIGGGSHTAVYFAGVTKTAFKFNDVSSSATGLTNAYLLQLLGSTVTIRNNVFLSSFVVTGSSASLFADAASGFDSDYNDWYSSTSLNTLVWAGKAYAYPWSGSLGRDANSISANPLWNNASAGAEDFHPRSTVGRYNPATQSFVADAMDSPEIDAADPAEPYALEPAPNGVRANLGSYGDTGEASESSGGTTSGCVVQKNVGAGQLYSTIQSAVNALPASLPGHACVVVKDGATYNEQVTVRNFASNGSSITIEADPLSGLTPIVSPPANSTAAFQIANASVSVVGLDIVPAASIQYGVVASSGYITISNVSLQDSAGYIWGAAVQISSWSAISYSSFSLTASACSVAGISLPGSAGSAISFSTASLNAGTALLLTGASSNTITSSALSANACGYGLWIYGGGSNTVARGTMTSLAIDRASGNTVTQSYVSNPGGYGARFGGDGTETDGFNTISFSTIIAQGGYPGLQFVQATSDTVSNSYIQGSTAVYVAGSTGAVISASVLVTTVTAGDALLVQAGAVNLSLSSSVLTAGAQGAAVFIDAANVGAIQLSTNTLIGGRYGVYAGTQTAAVTRLFIASNTVVAGLSTVLNTYGIYLNGLTSGATIQNNSIVWRQSGSASGQTAYGVYAQSSSGLNIDHNRISQPGLITAGSFVGAAFKASQQVAFKFNDVNSSGTALTNAYLIQLVNGSTVTVRDNVFVSSFVVSGSSASVIADALSGIGSDFNDWYSSTSANAFVWGNAAYSFPWSAATGSDARSISANPLWSNASAGVEDFHPRSTVGRWSPATQSFLNDGADSPVIDAADPAEGYALEPAPNGNRANQGSYGGTPEASKSAAVRPPPSGPAVTAVWLSSVTLAWTPVASGGYQVDASTAPDFSGLVYSSSTASGSAASLSPQGLWANATFYLRVGALYAGAPTYASQTSTAATLAQPVSGTQVYAVWPTSITVNWNPLPASPPNPSSVTAEGYTLEVSTSPGFSPILASSATPSVGLSTLTIAGLAQNSTYYLRVGSLNWQGKTDYAVTLSTFLPRRLPPMAPIGFTTAYTSATTTVQWLAAQAYSDGTSFAVPTSPTPAELQGYAVYRATAPTLAPWTYLVTVGTNALSWQDVSSGPQYYYQVQSYNGTGSSVAPMVVAHDGTIVIIGYDGASTFWVPAAAAAALNGQGGQSSTAYAVTSSSNAGDVTGVVLKSIVFAPWRGGWISDPQMKLSAMGTLRLHYDQAGGLVVPSGVRAASAQPLSMTPDTLSVFWYSGTKWVQLYGALDAVGQEMLVQTPYFGRYELRSVERVGAFNFDTSGITNRMITPNGDGKNDAAVFLYDNPRQSQVTGRIFDVRGRFVSDMAPGPVSNSFQWDAKSNGVVVPGGVYIYRIQAEGQTRAGTVIVVR